MDARKKVSDALSHKGGAAPHQINYTAAYAAEAETKIGKKDLDDLFGNSITLRKYKKNKPVGKDREVDLFGLTWDKSGEDGGDIGIPISPPILSPELGARGSFDGYTMPAPDLDFARAQAKALEADESGRFRMFGITFALYERAWGLRGMENALMDFISEPVFMHRLLESVVECHLKILDAVIEYDFDALYYADDWGTQLGLIMGAKVWREFIRPCFKMIVEKAKSGGKRVVLHSCGDNREIIGDWIDIGLDCYNTVQPEIYDLAWLKKEYGNDLAFYGGISNQRFLPYASAAEVKEHCLRVMDIMAEGGGYILAPANAITPDVPIENALAMAEAAREYGA